MKKIVYKIFLALVFIIRKSPRFLRRGFFKLLATLAYLTKNTVPDDARWTVLSFRGKAVVVPEIKVFQNEELIYVPVGSTLRHLLSQVGQLPELGMMKAGSFNGLRIPPRRIVGDSYVRINMGMYRHDTNGNDIFDLPLVKGDRIFY